MKRILTLLFFAILTLSLVNAQTEYEEIDSLVNAYSESGLFNGCIIVSDKGNIIYEKSVGYANFEWNIPNKLDTKFKIGSCTKQFTAALIMLLREEGKISLDDKISKYISNYPLDKGNQISIHQLLCHTSGIPEFSTLPEMEVLFQKENNPDEIIKTFWNLELNFEPGSKLSYSNSGYYLLGLIIEKITGMSYAQVLQERIFTPLSMTNSGIIKEDQVLANKAYGYIKADTTIKVASYINTSVAYSAGAIYSTVEDLFKWQIALQTHSILDEKSLDLMLTPNFNRYGYGFGILKSKLDHNITVTIYGHEGEINGFRSLIQIVREDNSSVILLDNNQNPHLYKIASGIRDILYEQD